MLTRTITIYKNLVLCKGFWTGFLKKFALVAFIMCYPVHHRSVPIYAQGTSACRAHSGDFEVFIDCIRRLLFFMLQDSQLAL